MKLKIILTVIIISTISISQAQTLKWSDNSADVLEQGKKEIGIFAPFKMGLKNNSEIGVHPILFFVIPNVSYKKQWKANDNYHFASVHTFTYPTFLLKILSRNGVGGILPATSTIPQLFKLDNTALLTINKFNQKFTFSAGLDLCLSVGTSDFQYIEWHIVYPRTYSLNNLFTPHAGIDVIGNIYKKFVYEYKFNSFFLTQVDKGIIFENQLKISWQKSDNFAVKVGVVYSYGTFPFGKDGELFPMFDLMFGF